MSQENIFATFIGIVYINDGIQGMVRLWEDSGTSPGHAEQYGSQDAASKLLTLRLGLSELWSLKSTTSIGNQPVCPEPIDLDLLGILTRLIPPQFTSGASGTLSGLQTWIRIHCILPPTPFSGW